MNLATINGPEFLTLFPAFVPGNGTWLRQTSIRDDRYALPEVSWLRGDYRGYFRRELERLGLTSWSEGDNDCDNRADIYRVHAQICKAAMKLGDGLALAVAYIEYYRSAVAPFGWHAINAAAVEDRRLIFIEPAYEAGSDVTFLTLEEQSSIRVIEI